PITKNAGQGVQHLPLRAIDEPREGGQRIQAVSFNGGNEGLWRSVRRDEIEPSPGRQSLFGQSQDAIRQRVAQPEIIKEPTVETDAGESAGDVVDMRHQAGPISLNRCPQLCTRSASIRTIGLRSTLSNIVRY